MSKSALHNPSPLKVLPAYLGSVSVEEALRTERGRRMLWLEILLNDQLDLATWQTDPSVQQAYQTACRWHTHYRRLLAYLFHRAPLPADAGPIDFRDYRTFAEAVYFVYAHR
ncbi:MAG: hypothetical protein K2Q17_14900 [Nitrospiraceae bacterium]|jgi:hypothetical protein|uniref:hypothetical protein n=1 Tax=Nitrospira cf. moscoviensis SBR1015 TaxID=96242 RepID=UPI000A0E6118|nr:hypothetical protein [Nitrospira cf. moscoviensis SBR1015]MBY0248948.1 hypothetical protein [Nitrospiraceae bacterium]OQW37755.1 MAG: hypothetical protein A4E20_17610 [Nitrospira sp. SG-bin2]